MVTTPATPKDPMRDECYTPPDLFETLRLEFDIDVCAPIGGVPWIPARRHYSKVDDGLSQPWEGRVWMNPPFSNCSPWVHRWLDHGNGLALLPTSRAQWFGRLWNSQAAIVHPVAKPMFTFIKNGKRTNIYMPVIVAALGADNANALTRLGRVR